MKKTLLQRAIDIEKTNNPARKLPFNKDELEVVVAFMNYQIGWDAVCKTVKGVSKGGSTNYGRLSKILRDGCRTGLVKIQLN